MPFVLDSIWLVGFVRIASKKFLVQANFSTKCCCIKVFIRIFFEPGVPTCYMICFAFYGMEEPREHPRSPPPIGGLETNGAALKAP